ncbi:MAG: hypothetical protein AAF493_22565 [Pseudomonadota bacterium]
MNFKKALLGLGAAAMMMGVAGTASAGNFPLSGTKCWVLDPVLGKETFVELKFRWIGGKQALFSGTAVRTDGQKPDRILQMSGSTSRHTFEGDGGVNISRHMLNLTYAFSKTGTDPANAYTETGAALRGHYAIRLNPANLDGYFEGNDIIMDFPGGLTGPATTSAADNSMNEYLGTISCDGNLVPGQFDNCGTIIPVNNAGSLTLVGSNAWQCYLQRP